MTNINLLPWREEQRKQETKQFLIYLLSALITVILLCVLVHVTYARILSSEIRGNNFLRSELTTLDQQIQEVRDIKEKKTELINRMEVVQQLQTNRTEIVQMFNEFVRTVPDGVYITSIEKKGKEITVTGKAESNTRVSEFMKNIEKSDAFMDPQLSEIKTGEKDNPDVRIFELQMQREPFSQHDHTTKGQS